jgi:hypothetical protein
MSLTNQIKIQTLIDNINQRYHAQISILDMSELVENLSLEFGEPIINVGGNFSAQAKRPEDEEFTQIEFSLPTKHRRLDSDFPVIEIFDLKDNCDADLYAKVWTEEICDRIVCAKNELLKLQSNFTGETIKTV